MRRSLTALLAAAAMLIPACSSDDDELPEAGELLASSSEAAAGIESTHFRLDTEGEVPGLPLESVDGELTKDGDSVAARGTVNASMIEGEFVLHGDTLYLDGGTGGYQQIPAGLAANVYDFSAVLDPDRGLAKLIGGVEEAETVGVEEVDGVEAYEIQGTVSQQALAGLVPRAGGDVNLTLWVEAESEHMPVKARASFPGQDGEEAGVVTVTLSEVNEPVTVEPPS
jgi:lipoprotein LprG